MKRSILTLGALMAAASCAVSLVGERHASAQEAPAPQLSPNRESSDNASFQAKLSLGAGHHRFLENSANTFNLAGGVGLGFKSVGVGLAARYEWGSTPGGVDVRTLGFGPYFEVVLSRVRLGLELSAMSFGFYRATNQELVDRWGLGARVHLTYDVLKIDGHAVYAGVDVHGLWARPEMEWGPSVYAGFRF